MPQSAPTQELFRRAIAQAQADGDPWASHKLHTLPAERCRRHRFNVLSGGWVVDETLVKVERRPFDKGAMRRCYRLKKLSQQPNRPAFHPLKWKTSNNYIGKQYHDASVMRDDGGRAAVLLDVQLQLTSAAFATAFDEALVPPKRVNIIDCFAIELYERRPVEYMLVERFITGKDEYGRGFIKHNSNIGYIDDNERRLTPQVFSAATFWLSRGAAMVTDIQGVGDLYTDPQVHCRSQRFGTGDLGRRGMAFFFQSYDGSRNPLFRVLGVPLFLLSPNELRRAANANAATATAAHKIRDKPASSYNSLMSEDDDDDGGPGNSNGGEWGFFANMSARDDALTMRKASGTATRRTQRASLGKGSYQRKKENGDEDSETTTISAIEKMMEKVSAQAARALVGILDEVVDKLAPRLDGVEFDVASVLSEFCQRDSCRKRFHDRLGRGGSSSALMADVDPPKQPSGKGVFGRWASKWGAGLHYYKRSSGTVGTGGSGSGSSTSSSKKSPQQSYAVNDEAERAALVTENNDDRVRWALAEVHAALAELEAEGRFTDWQPDATSSLFHTARAAELGSPVAAHALGRWHAGLAPGALAPHDATLGRIRRDPTRAGPLLVLAARRGDAAAAFHAARAFLEGDLGLPADRRAAEKLLRFALKVATNVQPKGPITGFRIGDIVEVDYRNNGFYYEARVCEVRDDGTADVVYLEDDETERRVDWLRIQSRNTDKKTIPAGKAGASLPPKHRIIAELADLQATSNRYKAAILLDEAALAAVDLLAPRAADTYRERASRLRRRS